MEEPETVNSLMALGHETRLRIYRLLETSGAGGLASGEIARRFDMPPTSVSNHLGVLARAGVIVAERQGRSIVYRSRPDRVRALARALVDGEA